ncbi:bifunctional 3-(3-hydroxy-phenyl)propionate/3-hydroxycinnamic acid hydroxylase [Pseudomonas aeruginosa]|uniref:bifunctional 3-(3-hydroxy-phenyl)propionate/3-hydroxycinnamic acid hydroxylase n=1 Tax=Pseudomonas aeruginosa TaxID=287 RepID=UPI000EB29BFF|nr:bifunctional 3-(3-hydroxy-phenyl)propionate/3-hydroxycinnamic acid hydroxylase [Pseudomonas aeruginosa]HBO3146296.1 bifunctional 3-(3-hydroxy-phenyl)propionate/3-hydroxycinnamic acid hydroxylase [Pseudomonas aeruginosa]HCL4166290.1 bifunctional 3-(3-hydroxy-phenyl)propionate/3-hydroxycinnamic acid hydroxylase [Pseudomonas aeruginosa]
MDYDLVIVGMGPVGVTAANLAGQWGLKTLVLDKSDTIYQNPRAMGLDQEVMRTFDNIGVADALAAHVMPYRASHYLNGEGQLIKRIEAARAPHLLGWAPNYVFSQPPLERALRENLQFFSNIEVRLGCEVLDVEESDGICRVRTSKRDGSVEEVSSTFVMACDGGTSPLRTRLQLRMDDLEFDEPWLVVDVLLKEGAGAHLPETNVQYCDTERPSTFVVGPGRHRRWEFMINPGETPADIVRTECIQQLISRWLPADEYDIWRASTYRFHALILERWRVGNLLFLGDAAHMTPPFLAQGMCQGIRDAMNLVWKIALIRRGLATPSLLDTYQEERAPHVRRTTEVAKAFGQTICERNPARAVERDKRLQAEMQSNPGGTIRQSLIPGLSNGLIGHQDPAGQLFPQPRVVNHRGEENLLDRFTGQSFRLVIASTFSDPDTLLKQLPQLLGDCRLPLAVVRLRAGTPQGEGEYRELDGLLSEWMIKKGCQVLLVRPDHYIYGSANDVEQSVALFKECLQRLLS